MVAKALPEDDEWKNPLKETIRYWKAFVVHSKDSNQLIAISVFMNQGNKVRQFEASWAANIVAEGHCGSSTTVHQKRGRTLLSKTPNGR